MTASSAVRFACVLLQLLTLVSAAFAKDLEPVTAGHDPDRHNIRAALDRLEAAAGPPGALQVRQSGETGLVTAIVTAQGVTLPVAAHASAGAREVAMQFVTSHGALFGVRGESDLAFVSAGARDEAGLERVLLQQLVGGVPVAGSYLIVQVKGNAVTRVMAKTSAEAANTPTTSRIPASRAVGSARQLIAKYLRADDVTMSKPRLEILDRELLEGRRTGRPELAWFIEARRVDIREYIWIEATRGAVLLHFSQLPHARSRSIYTAGSMDVIPGTLVRSEGGAATGDPDADAAYNYSGHTYDYFSSQHGRDSYDGAGAPLISTVHYCRTAQPCPFQNAFWNGTQMVYGEGYSLADDVDAHELTHAVTEYSANLYYYMQSGALNESYSDIFGEVVDLTNGAGNDSAAVRWMAGEDLPGGAIRHMMDPNAFGDPARMGDPLFYCSSGDGGGVHSNSGVPNHAFALMVDGGTFNGTTVAPLGVTKAAKIAYRTLTTYLGPTSNFIDAYQGTVAACGDLIGLYGITSVDCGEVKDALDAVEMDLNWKCAPNAPPVPQMCDVGGANVLASESFEDIYSGAWSTSALSGVNHWTGLAGTPDIYSTRWPSDGSYGLWGYGAEISGNSVVSMVNPILVSAGMKLQFDHSYEFELNFDNGMIEYSLDGVNWNDALTLIAGGATYNGSGYTGSSYGYTQTQLDLSSLAGSSVRFRFRITTDGSVGRVGWFIDNLRFYRCVPSVDAADVTIAERDLQTPATIRVTLSAPSSETISVDYGTMEGTATEPEDYVATSGVLTFSPGQTLKYVTVPIQGDLTDEADERFQLVLSNPVNAAITSSTADIVIRDNDVVTMSVSDSTVTEPNSGSVNPTFTVTLSGPSSETVSVNIATANITATAGSDYTARSFALTFSPGQVTRTFSISVLGDTLDEPEETFRVNLSGVINAAIADGIGIGTIVDNDPPRVSINDTSVTEGDSGSVNATFTLSLSSAHSTSVSVNVATANSTAAAGADYTALASTTITFTPGQTSKTVSVPVLGDTLQEPTETFVLNVTAPVNATIADNQGTCTINDNDQPKLSINNASVTEGSSGTKTLSFAVSMAPPSASTVSVSWSTANGSAVSGSDYVAASGSLSFSPGQVSKAIAITLNGDTTDEPDEGFFVNLSTPVNATILDGQGIGTIIDDDGPSITINNVTVTERNGTDVVTPTFTVSLSAASPQTVSVNFFTTDGTASSGSDYTARPSTTLTFAPGQTTRALGVTVLGDDVDEPDETFNVQLTGAVGGTITDGVGVGTIIDNDTPNLTISDVTVTETNSGTINPQLVVTLSSASDATVTVNVNTANGTASAGSDYTARSFALSFSPGVTSRTFSVSVLGDVLNESNEVFFAVLSGPTNATIAKTQGQITIVDND